MGEGWWGGTESLILVFILGVIQGNEEFGGESRELRGSVSPRFPCVVPVVERFSSDLLPAIISY